MILMKERNFKTKTCKREVGEILKESRGYKSKESPECRLPSVSFDNLHPLLSYNSNPIVGLGNRTTKLATDAVKEDMNNKVPQSINLYCESLLFLVPHVHVETDPRKKAVLRKKVNEYIERAEELKDSLKQNFISNKQRNKVCDLEYKLQNLYSENPKVIASLKLLKHAEVLETEDKFKEALEKYELGIAGLMAVLSVETDEERKSLLRRQVAEWLKRAEQIKSYLSVNNVQSKESSQINNSSPGRQQCVIQ
ncbi:Serine/threonine-protein kinase ULK3 [Nymphon striatum]|nr:Serine/threonine-protein kinase ULK3 [Nymphon striatum]